MKSKEILLGNGAIALGLLEGGCRVLTSYPGTPSSEILPEATRLIRKESLNTYVEWSVNEKVAFDIAFAAAVAGKRSACCMKQVGLNVAADSLMSAAYLGVTGGFVIISCDDPGPHSSQTEQDTRLMARLAKVPVLDPSSPEEARKMAAYAMNLSEEFQIPVILRPAIRVCHARQNMSWDSIEIPEKEAKFERNPARWAATPKFRLKLHGELNRKLDKIANRFESLSGFNHAEIKKGGTRPIGIIAGGVSYAVVRDILDREQRKDIPLMKLGAPYPFPEGLVRDFMNACDRVLVLEETDSLIEYLINDRSKVFGRTSGHVPRQGELVPEAIHSILNRVLPEAGVDPVDTPMNPEIEAIMSELDLPVMKPTLCPGCPHRAAFYTIRKGRAKTIFTSDIGCYTLGINLGGVDTCLDMGAAITMASGFYQAFAKDGKEQPIIATIGDSTFYHSGTAGLLNAVYNDARFILVILDNQTTAMTGMQPTPGTGFRADGSMGKTVSLERLVSGCGVDFIEVVDPYDMKAMEESLKRAEAYTRAPDGGIAVVISRHPCLIAYRSEAISEKRPVRVTQNCNGCGYCIKRFECPALITDPNNERTNIDTRICAQCGLCVFICPQQAIVEMEA